MVSWEGIISLLKVFLAIFIFFGIPALMFLVVFVFWSSVMGFLSGTIGTRLFSRLPRVSWFIDQTTSVLAGTESPESTKRQRPKVLGIILVFYGVAYLFLHMMIVESIAEYAEWIPGGLGSPWASGIVLLYPVYTLLITVPVMVGIQWYAERDNDVSVIRLGAEWSVFFIVVNTVLFVLVYGLVIFSTILILRLLF